MVVDEIIIPDSGNYLFILEPGCASLPDPKLLTEKPSLEILQFGVQGYIEVVPFFNNLGQRPCVAFCNEEGKLKGMARNDYATILWQQALGPRMIDDYLVGNIVIVVADPKFLENM
jgi:Domain of unknown function (DUF3846)